MPSLKNPLQMFLALFALYSPLASVSSYFPIVGRLAPRDRAKLSLGLFVHVTIFAVVALWIGEPLLKLLGITTAALTVTGGIALLYSAIPLMRGVDQGPTAEEGASVAPLSWRSVLLLPVTFPLTVGGTTFAIFVSFRSEAEGLAEVVALTLAAVAYAAVTGLTIYASGQLERRVSHRMRILLERIAGILLTSIGVMLLASGGPRLVVETLRGLQH